MNPYDIGFTIGTIVVIISTLIGAVAAFWILLKMCQIVVGKKGGKFLFVGILVLFVRIVIFAMNYESVYSNMLFR